MSKSQPTLLAISAALITGFAASPALAVTPLLQTLAETTGGVTVVFGADATSMQAAQVIHDAIRTIPGQEGFGSVVTAAEFNAKDMTVTGGTHVIAVGTLTDNEVIATRNWLPSWFMDRDWYYSKYKWAVSPADIGLPYQPTQGYMAAGYGEWPTGEGRVGYIEVDRSFFFMEWLVRTRMGTAQDATPALANVSTITTPAYPKDAPLRLIVRVTGSGGAGVVQAATAFATGGLLSGVVLAGANADSGPTLFTLPADRYASALPFTPPAKVGTYDYQGWLLPDAYQYDGFRKTTGVTAQKMFRVKYKPATGITGFWSSPHRRASQFEVCAVKLASAEDATRAEAALKAAAAKLPASKEGRISTFGTAVTGSILYVRSIPGAEGEAVLSAFAGLPQW